MKTRIIGMILVVVVLLVVYYLTNSDEETNLPQHTQSQDSGLRIN